MLTIGPEFDCAQRMAESFGIRDKLQYLICNTDSIYASKIGVIQATKESVIRQVHRWQNTRTGEVDINQIDVYSLVYHFDNRNVCVLDRCAFFDRAVRGHLFEEFWKVREEVIAGNKFRCYYESVYVRS